VKSLAPFPGLLARRDEECQRDLLWRVDPDDTIVFWTAVIVAKLSKAFGARGDEGPEFGDFLSKVRFRRCAPF
jgi:hypothetical protein